MNRVKVVPFDSQKYQFSFTVKIPLTLFQKGYSKKGLVPSIQGRAFLLYLIQRIRRSNIYFNCPTGQLVLYIWFPVVNFACQGNRASLIYIYVPAPDCIHHQFFLMWGQKRCNCFNFA